ncbi:transmembrane protein, putative, partial (macronuclear) [Tetrahymena thermophila SB210]
SYHFIIYYSCKKFNLQLYYKQLYYKLGIDGLMSCVLCYLPSQQKLYLMLSRIFFNLTNSFECMCKSLSHWLFWKYQYKYLLGMPQFLLNLFWSCIQLVLNMRLKYLYFCSIKR